MFRAGSATNNRHGPIRPLPSINKEVWIGPRPRTRWLPRPRRTSLGFPWFPPTFRELRFGALFCAQAQMRRYGTSTQIRFHRTGSGNRDLMVAIAASFGLCSGRRSGKYCLFLQCRALPVTLAALNQLILAQPSEPVKPPERGVSPTWASPKPLGKAGFLAPHHCGACEYCQTYLSRHHSAVVRD